MTEPEHADEFSRAEPPTRSGPIGVFDSGVGGLTVVKALRDLLPGEDIFYIGDTARVPYGGKSGETVARYSLEIAGLLLAERAKMIVVACNSASAHAVERLRETLKVPVVGVIGPGAELAVRTTKNQRVGVIGTRATVRSGAYERNLFMRNPELAVHVRACPLLVPLVEEGLFQDEITDQALRRYTGPLLDEGIDTLVLGCTHYPLLQSAIERVTGPGVTLINSATACAEAVRRMLEKTGLGQEQPGEEEGNLRVAFTDPPDDFLRLADEALGLEISEVLTRRVQTYAMA